VSTCKILIVEVLVVVVVIVVVVVPVVVVVLVVLALLVVLVLVVAVPCKQIPSLLYLGTYRSAMKTPSSSTRSLDSVSWRRKRITTRE